MGNDKNDSVLVKLEYNPKKLRVVKTADVRDVSKELQMRFRSIRKNLNDMIEENLFHDQNKKSGIISIKELSERFLG